MPPTSVKNKERRRLNKARRRKQQRSAGRKGVGGRNFDESGLGACHCLDDEVLDDLIVSAAHADCLEVDEPEALVEFLCGGCDHPGGQKAVSRRLTSRMTRSQALLLQNRWEPHEIQRVLRRKTGTTGARVTVSALRKALDHCAPEDREAWRQEVEDWLGDARVLDPDTSHWSSDVEAALRSLGVLEHLSPMPDSGLVGAKARVARSGEEERLLARVRGLLAKAESSEFPDEADALMAKAQELMARHCLDRALVEEGLAGGQRPLVEARRCWLEDPYLDAKAILLSVVAGANRCRSVACGDVGFSTLVGHPDDLDSVELLFTSLLVQATQRINALKTDPAMSQRSRRPSYRRSFFAGYAHRIGDRLREAADAATAGAAEQAGGRLLPILARRSEAVDDAVDSLFGKLDRMSVTVSDRNGWVAGMAAAEMAELVTHQELPLVG